MIVFAQPVLPAKHTIKEWPATDRPRERLRELGARALSTRELLALIIETGMPARDGEPAMSSMDVAGELLRYFTPVGEAGSLRRIMAASVEMLCQVPGIGPAKAAKIHAALELGRRLSEESRPDGQRIATARDVFERMRVVMRDLPQEEFHVLPVNAQNEIIRDVCVSRGTVDASLVHARDVFAPVLNDAAVGVILVHNHPSGEPHPSLEDERVTDELAKAGRALGIPVLDHIIVGECRYVSFNESGRLAGGFKVDWLNPACRRYAA